MLRRWIGIVFGMFIIRIRITITVLLFAISLTGRHTVTEHLHYVFLWHTNTKETREKGEFVEGVVAMENMKRLPESELRLMMIIWDAGEPVASPYILEKLVGEKGA